MVQNRVTYLRVIQEVRPKHIKPGWVLHLWEAGGRCPVKFNTVEGIIMKRSVKPRRYQTIFYVLYESAGSEGGKLEVCALGDVGFEPSINI